MHFKTLLNTLYFFLLFTEKGYMFLAETFYPEITMICSETKENKFKWQWVNNKNESQTELPECTVSNF